MIRVAMTGAGGFIGTALARDLRDRGAEVVACRRNGAWADGTRWELGAPLPIGFAPDAVIHCASAALGGGPQSGERDIEGSRVLIAQARQWRAEGHRCKFIFLSSQSARPDALNRYGRSKWAIEQLLGEPDEIVLQPGLVYGDSPASVFATFERLSRLPVVPVVAAPAAIQPVHVRDLAACVWKLVTMAEPPRLVRLGAEQPLTFRDAIAQTARRAGRRPPLMIPVPLAAARAATQLLDLMLAGSLTERLDGLVGLAPIDTKPSLELLGLRLTPFLPAPGHAS